MAVALCWCAASGSGPAQAGDCRAVVQHAYAANVVAYRANHYAPSYYQAAIVAVEQPYYSVDLLAPELRAKQRAREQAGDIESLKEISRQNADAIRLLYQLQSKTGEAPAGPLAVESEDARVVGILKTHCAKCHSGDAAKGGLRLFEADGRAVALTAEHKFLVESVTNDNSMPPSGAKLSADEYQAIRKWYEADRAAVRSLVKAAAAK